MDTLEPTPRRVVPFPWGTLPTLPREAPALLRDARRAVDHALNLDQLAAAISEVIGTRATVRVPRIEVATEVLPPISGVWVALTSSDGSLRIDLELDREFARTLVARAIGRPTKLGHPRGDFAPELEGALLAVVLQVARRAHGGGDVLVPVGPGSFRLARGERRLYLHSAVTIEADRYAVRATIEQKTGATWGLPKDPRKQLASLGNLPISLPLVVAAASIRSSDLQALSTGDVWLPGDGWTAQLEHATARLVGDGVLASPAGERGLAVKLGADGKIVLLGEKAISLDVETTMDTANQNETATSEVVLDAPLMMRVEVGAVTLSAGEWAALGPGDVIALGRRVNEPVLLRIAGSEVGRGELVDIEGELGVRIRERSRSV